MSILSFDFSFSFLFWLRSLQMVFFLSAPSFLEVVLIFISFYVFKLFSSASILIVLFFHFLALLRASLTGPRSLGGFFLVHAAGCLVFLSVGLSR